MLAQSGQDVTFIARGEHLRTIPEKGLQINSVHGNFLLSEAQATDNPLKVGPVDLVLFTTKTLSSTDECAPDLKPSMQRDVEAGRISELESMIGTVVGLGKEFGVSTPVMRFTYAALKPGQLKTLA